MARLRKKKPSKNYLKRLLASSRRKNNPTKVDLDEYGEQLKKAVASGKMTEEEAIAKYKEAMESQKSEKERAPKKKLSHRERLIYKN